MEGGIQVNLVVSEGSGYQASNNAVCGAHAAVNVGPGVTSSANRSAASCPTWFVNPASDPAAASFAPAPRSPLLGGADPSPPALGTAYIGSIPWSPTDRGRAPGPAPSIGAYPP
jgi:hypothetical protein